MARDRGSPTGKGAAGRRVVAQVSRALQHRNYRLYFAGQGTSVVGTWITRVATSWLVYRLTGSAALLGVVGFAGQVPAFVLAPFAGVWIDRTNRRRLLVVTQALAMLQSLALAILALSGTIAVWHVLALQLFQGCINAFDMPGRQSFLHELVEDRADLPNAIALNSSMVNGARLVGPTIAGLLIAATGEGWCFLLDAVSYLAVIGSLLAMRLPAHVVKGGGSRLLHDLRQGVHYAFAFLPIRAVLMLLALVCLTGVPYTVLMPVIAVTTLHGGPHTYGFLMGATGVGALVGAIYLASRTSVLGLGRIIPLAAILFGAGLITFALSHSLAMSLFLLLFAGGGFMVLMAASNTLLQTLVREEMRGRVMAFYTMAFMGTTPFGSLVAGVLAERIGAPRTIMIGGAACLVGGAAFFGVLPAVRAMARPVYVERGILPAVTEGVSQASVLTGGLEQ
ncbi:MAG: MFS transporter [Gemmatimonadales bacterium]